MKTFDPYLPNNIPLFETLYGNHLISLGGFSAIDNMFSDLNIQGLNALDIGFGLGGVAFYLAQKYQMRITGIEIHSWMVQYAKEHAPQDVTNKLKFETYNSNGELPYHKETFDLVYSKGVLNHIADKINLFRQINSVLKPNGLFVIADWISPKTISNDSTPLVNETKETYEHVLIDAGFDEITFRDDSSLFLNYTKDLLSRLSKNKDFITEKYDEELFTTILNQHEELFEKISQSEKIAARIVAKKISY